MEILLKVIHVIASVFLVLVVLLQSGKGGGVGAAFGGASGQIFGGRGASTFLSRVTSGAAVVFFLTSLTLSMMSSRHRSVVLRASGRAPVAAPADANGVVDPNATGATPAADSEAVKEGQAAEPAKKPDAPAATPPGVPEGTPPPAHAQ
ncbi:MAG TPA: preprotein translocase subunit SecG [Myxococcota bacterium]|nr:preprotein translocase subunit SecG [Myxococcota bacterium]